MVFVLDVGQFADGNLPAANTGKVQRLQGSDAGAVGPAQLHADGNVLARIGSMQQTRSSAIQPNFQGAAHVRSRDTMQRSFVEIDLQVVLHLGIFDVPVDVHHPGRGLEDVLDLLGHLDLLLVVGTINFGDQRLAAREARAVPRQP